MTVTKLYAEDNVFDASPSNTSELKPETMRLLGECVLYNCSAIIEKGVAHGNNTEVGLINYLLTVGIECEKMLEQKADYTLSLIPFNSKRKRATTVMRNPEVEGEIRAYTKGAPEIVIKKCAYYID